MIRIKMIRKKMVRRIKTGWLPASYTVEAALIFPLILGILFAFLYFLYYEHDKAVFRGNLKEAVLSLTGEAAELPEDAVWREQLQEHLWMGKVTEGKASVTALLVRGSGKVEMKLSIPVMRYFPASKQTIQWSYTADRWQPEQFVRQKGSKAETGEESSG